MAKVIWRNAALDDLDRIFYFIATHNDQAARRVAERLIACVRVCALSRAAADPLPTVVAR